MFCIHTCCKFCNPYGWKKSVLLLKLKFENCLPNLNLVGANEFMYFHVSHRFEINMHTILLRAPLLLIISPAGVSWDKLIYTLHRADSRFAPSQWETALLSNDISHWLGANLESALPQCLLQPIIKMLMTWSRREWVTSVFVLATTKQHKDNCCIFWMYSASI